MIPLALDTETALIKAGCTIPPLTCVSVSSGPTSDLWHVNGVDSLGFTAASQCWQVIKDPTILIIGHNIAFDMAVIANEWPDLMPEIFATYDADRVTCTQTRQYLCDIAAGIYKGFEDTEDGHAVKLSYSLDALTQRHCGVTLDKSTYRLGYGALRDVPLHLWEPGARQYPIDDACWALRVWEKQEVNAAFLHDQYRQSRAAFWLCLMSAYGLRTDARGVRELAAITQRSYDNLASDLRAAGLLRPDKTVRHRDGTSELVLGSRNTKYAGQLMIQAYNERGEDCPMTDGGVRGNPQPALDKLSCIKSGSRLLKRPEGPLAESPTFRT